MWSLVCRAVGVGRGQFKKLLRGRDGSGEYVHVGEGNGAVQMTDMEGAAANGAAAESAPEQWDEEAQALVLTVQVRPILKSVMISYHPALEVVVKSATRAIDPH